MGLSIKKDGKLYWRGIKRDKYYERAKRRSEWLRTYYAKLKLEVLEAYGSKCACCGETEPLFLELDHIHNDGKVDRQRHNGLSLMIWLKELGFPKDRYQLLCANCNQGKARNNGICPHQLNRT